MNMMKFELHAEEEKIQRTDVWCDRRTDNREGEMETADLL